MKKTVTLAVCVLLSVCGLSLAACNTVMMGGGAAALQVFDRPNVNLEEKSYAAADYLMQAGGNFVDKNRDDVKAVAIQNVSEPNLTTKIGRVIAYQTGSRLQQLGYHVDLTDVASDTENNVPYVAQSRKSQPEFILTGTYLDAHSKLDVRLHLVNARTGAVVAQFDYNMPMSYEIQRLSRPKPQIYRTTGQQLQ